MLQGVAVWWFESPFLYHLFGPRFVYLPMARLLRRTRALCIWLAAGALVVSAQDAAKVRVVGTVSGADQQQVMLKTDVGASVAAHVTSTTRILRAVPGQKDLASAPAVALSDIHTGDRVLVSGISSDGGKSIDAITLVVMS